MTWLNLLSLLGMFALCGIAWLGSENRRVIPWRVIVWGIGLQLVLGLLVFLVPLTRDLFVQLNVAVNAVLDATESGARFIFGDLLVPNPTFVPGPVLVGRWIARAIAPPYVPVAGDRLLPENLNLGYVFAFRALPSVIFFSALMALLYALRVIQPIVNVFARIFRWAMNLSGAEALSGAANIFVGIEATLVVRPYLAEMTRSELCAILASCFGSIASTVLALYSQLLRPVFPNITGHLVSASIMAIPACFVMAKILVPETETPKTLGQVVEDRAEEGVEGEESSEAEEIARISPMESLIVGALDGVKLAVAIAALLIAVLGLVALVKLFFANLASLALSSNPLIQGTGKIFQVVNLQNILGALFLPLTFLTGVSGNWQELWQASLIIGQRLLETEIPAYLQLAKLSSEGVLSHRALVVVSYALCGFAHIPSVGIFVGGLIGLVPSRRKDIAELGWKALWAATLATLMIGCVAGIYDMGNPAIIGK
jgi:CNT family concentrative nucleoside transporter